MLRLHMPKEFIMENSIATECNLRRDIVWEIVVGNCRSEEALIRLVVVGEFGPHLDFNGKLIIGNCIAGESMPNFDIAGEFSRVGSIVRSTSLLINMAG